MISTSIPSTLVVIEHLDSAADCCKEAAETLAHAQKLNPGLKPQLGALRDQLASLSAQITQLRAGAHRDAFPAPMRRASSIFPLPQASGLVPLL